MGAGCGSACLPFGVSAGVGVSGSLCYFADVSKIGQDTAGCSAFLSALSLCLWCAVLEYGSISHFKGVFSAVWGFGVGLCCLGALRGLWGFCARVELGGLKACGVFAFRFVLLSLCLLSFYTLCLSSGALPLLFSACPLALSLWVFGCVVVSFSLSVYTQKERARRVGASSLVLLWVVSLVPCALLRVSGYFRLCMPLYLP